MIFTFFNDFRIHDSNTVMERWVAKVIALVVIGMTIFLCTALPIKVSQWFARKGNSNKLLPASSLVIKGLGMSS